MRNAAVSAARASQEAATLNQDELSSTATAHGDAAHARDHWQQLLTSRLQELQDSLSGMPLLAPAAHGSSSRHSWSEQDTEGQLEHHMLPVCTQCCQCACNYMLQLLACLQQIAPPYTAIAGRRRSMTMLQCGPHLNVYPGCTSSCKTSLMTALMRLYLRCRCCR